MTIKNMADLRQHFSQSNTPIPKSHRLQKSNSPNHHQTALQWQQSAYARETQGSFPVVVTFSADSGDEFQSGRPLVFRCKEKDDS
ncbi:hypothetical protein Hanom_Chr11g01020281 [Helianthus anomalus]